MTRLSTKTIVDEMHRKIFMREGSPCINCIVQATCTKSARDETACEPLKEFIMKLVRTEVVKGELKNHEI